MFGGNKGKTASATTNAYMLMYRLSGLQDQNTNEELEIP